jgi:hypothetical protein
VQRVVRAQRLAAGFYPHFGLFGLVTAGRDTGSLRFERSALAEQLRIAIRGLAAAGLPGVQIALTPLPDRGERIAAAVTADLVGEAENVGAADVAEVAGDAGAADLAGMAGDSGAAGVAGVAGDAGTADLAGMAAGPGGAEVVIDWEQQAGRGYYRDLCFKVNAYPAARRPRSGTAVSPTGRPGSPRTRRNGC